MSERVNNIGLVLLLVGVVAAGIVDLRLFFMGIIVVWVATVIREELDKP
jgi:hypothetical protein